MNTTAQSKSVTITLDKERTITYNNRAEFRMGSLERPFSVHDLAAKKRSWAALVAWVWACLSERDALDFPSPELLAAHIDPDGDNIRKIVAAFAETWSAAQEPKNVQG